MNFKFLGTTLVVVLMTMSSLFAQVSIPSKQATKSLNGQWKFKLCPPSLGKDSSFFEPKFDVSQWASIKVPSNWELEGFSKPKYGNDKLKVEENGLYRTEFSVSDAWKKTPIYICFDGVLHGYTFWVNGNYAGEFSSAFNRQIFDISAWVKAGQSNVLAVKVNRCPRGFDFDIFDCWSLSGIFRDVSVFTVPQNHLKDLTIKTFVASNQQASLNVKALLENKNHVSKNLTVNAKLIDASGKVVKEFSCNPSMWAKNSDTLSFNQSVLIENPHLWTAETPYLYTLEINVKNKKELIQTQTLKIGIREVSWKEGVLKLNGTAIKLRGVNHHDLSPTKGRSVSESEMLEDLKLIREANINYIRTSHYPPMPRFLELCDSLGFYVMDEVAFGWGEDHLEDSTYLDNLLNRALKTFERDKNHACVLVWSIGNENPLTKICIQTGRYMQSLDPSRPICYPQIGSYFNKIAKEIPSSVDILAPHYPNNGTLKSYSNRFKQPMIVTEYAHSLGLDFGRMQEQWEIICSSPKFAGGSVWHFFDQGLLRKATKPIGKYEFTNYAWLDSLTYFDTNNFDGADGLVYANRVPQVDYWQARKVYTPVKPLSDTVIYNSSTSSFALKLINRYDFTNLSQLTCQWQLYADTSVLQSGICDLNCKPHDTTLVLINAVLPAKLLANYYYLKLSFSDKNKYQCYEKVFMVRKPNSNLVSQLCTKSSSPTWSENRIRTDNYQLELNKDKGTIDLKNKNGQVVLSQGVAARVSRKATMAGRIASKEDLVLNKSESKIGKLTSNQLNINYIFSSDNKKIPTLKGDVNYFFSDSGYIKVNYSLSPDTTQANTLETGVSFVIPASMTEFRWIGKGLYAGYTGKNKLNEFGFYHLTSEDIYFQGNRQDVDCAIFSDKQGNGLMILANKANIAIERTSNGFVVSHNAFVSGRFNKRNKPELYYSFADLKTIEGTFTIIPITDKWSPNLEKLFGKPTKQVIPFVPFYNSYDQN